MKRPIKAKPARSQLEVLDIPLEDLIPDEDNPNVMSDATMDLLIEEIREQGFDEPIQVRPHPTMKGKYQISGGHHRVKAATVIGMTSVPAVVKNFSDRQQKVALVKRNVMKGDMDRVKLAKLYQTLASQSKDPVQLQRELGFSDPKKLDFLIEEAGKNLTPKQKKKLADAKEKIKSVDDLSSVLNRIFKESGSEIDEGYVVFSFGGKQHHYFQIDDATNDALNRIKSECDRSGRAYKDALQSIIAGAAPATVKPVIKKKKPGSK